ncbi:MAG TPA: hypothetical protein VFU47_06015 [Armatimonadota bacterium]|nr:hypothetical protein [Armatimonadota bacterium]
MRIDGTVEINAGEKRPAYVEVDAGSGNTLTVLDTTTTPAAAANPAFVLTDADGATVASGTVTGYDSGAVQMPRVWYVIDATALGLAAGVYTLEFTFEAKAAGEGFTRRYVRRVAVWVD